MTEEESEHRRWQRNFEELLQELRVAQTGNQILFAFLLALPFAQRFTEITEFQRDVYIGTILCTAIATILVIAPVSHHRIAFRKGLKPHIARTASRLAAVSLFFMLLGLTGAVYLAVAVASGQDWAALFAAGIAALGAGIWYLYPVLAWRRHLTNGSSENGHHSASGRD